MRLQKRGVADLDLPQHLIEGVNEKRDFVPAAARRDADGIFLIAGHHAGDIRELNEGTRGFPLEDGREQESRRERDQQDDDSNAAITQKF